MSFKQYLVEYYKSHSNEADLVFHKILDNLDNGHVDYDNNKLLFNVGNIIKDKRYSKLYVAIRAMQDSNGVRLGHDKNGNLTIVVDSTEDQLPDHQNIDKFLDNIKIITAFKREFAKVLEKHDTEGESDSHYEQHNSVNANFQQLYSDIIDSVNDKTREYHEALKHLEDGKFKTTNAGKHAIFDSAKEKILADYFGNSFAQFKSKVLKAEHGSQVEHLTPENKKKLLSRLESYYEQKVAQLTKAK